MDTTGDEVVDTVMKRYMDGLNLKLPARLWKMEIEHAGEKASVAVITDRVIAEIGSQIEKTGMLNDERAVAIRNLLLCWLAGLEQQVPVNFHHLMRPEEERREIKEYQRLHAKYGGKYVQ